jgi:phage repressor protein C with HTH and peptisase S24 domain
VSEIGNRILDRIEALGLSQSELARRVGITQPAIANLVKRGGRSSHLHAIARELQTTPEYLLLGSGDATTAPTRAQATPEALDTVEIAEFNVAYGLGGAFIHDSLARQTMRTFSRAWVRQFTQSPMDKLFWATSSGTSMMPAILDSDLLLIDTMQQTPRMWDQLWAIEMHGLGMIKSLRPGKEGAMRILSLNPDYPEELAYDGEMNVIGRVVAIVRKV